MAEAAEPPEGDEAAEAAEAAEASADEHAATTDDGGPPIGAIIAGCLGVLFGGLIARWQIKALAKRG